LVRVRVRVRARARVRLRVGVGFLEPPGGEEAEGGAVRDAEVRRDRVGGAEQHRVSLAHVLVVGVAQDDLLRVRGRGRGS
jgi:hypothetical protein